MKARALLIEALVGIASAAVAAGAFCWMASDIAAEYAYKALVSVAEMSKQYNTIIELLNNIAISEHGNTHEQFKQSRIKKAKGA